MGGRLLKKWVSRPLKKTVQIQKRLDAVEDLLNSRNERKKLSEILNSIAEKKTF